MPIDLALLEVLLGDLREVGVEDPLAGHLHGEAVGPRGRRDLSEARDRGVGGVGELHGDERAPPVLRDQARRLLRRALDQVVVRDGRARQGTVVDGGHPALHVAHRRFEPRIVDGERVRVHDDVLGIRLGAAELRVEHDLRPLRLRVVRELGVLAQDAGQQPGSDRAHRDDQHHPQRERPPRVAAAGPRHRFGVQLHGRSLPRVDRLSRPPECGLGDGGNAREGRARFHWSGLQTSRGAIAIGQGGATPTPRPLPNVSGSTRRGPSGARGPRRRPGRTRSASPRERRRGRGLGFPRGRGARGREISAARRMRIGALRRSCGVHEQGTSLTIGRGPGPSRSPASRSSSGISAPGCSARCC